MNLLIYFTAYHWNNCQGGSGKYIAKKILFKVPNFIEAQNMWANIHDEVRKYLKDNRTFDQTIYSKSQAEYTITTVEVL